MVRVMVVGMGPIGIACARAVAADRDMSLCGMVDVDPAKVGKTLEDLDPSRDGHEAAAGAPAGENHAAPLVRVTAGMAQALASAGADVAIVTTTSRFDRLIPTLQEAMALGLNVVSSCEEMSWPWYQHPQLAKEIDDQARHAGRALLGTGVNPGFVMDSLAVAMTTAVRRVTGVRCVRRVDAALRRLPLQAKVGATLSVEQFRQRQSGGKIGHVGLPESVAMLAHGLGHSSPAPGSIEVRLEPVIAQQPLPCALGLVEPGRVAGIHHTAHWSNGALTIELDLTMAVGTTEPRDVIEIQGPVSIKTVVKGGLPGDSATVAVLVNYARMLATAAPGLHSMLSLPMAGCRGTDR